MAIKKEIEAKIRTYQLSIENWKAVRDIAVKSIKDLECQFAGLENQLEELDKPDISRGWTPQEMETYWYISDIGKIESYQVDNIDYDKQIFNNNLFGIFKTEEQAKQAYDRHMAGEELKRIISEENHRHGWKIDWEKRSQLKNYLYYSLNQKKVIVGEDTTLQYYENELYFSNKSSINHAFLAKIKPLWIKSKGIKE